MALILAVVGFLLVLFSVFAPALGIAVPVPAQILFSATGAVMLILSALLGFLSFYRRTSADRAFVRTGAGGSKVVLDGSAPVIPFLHKVIEINLRTMKLGVNPRGTNALITRDNLRANVLAQFYIRVQADVEHILNAARSLGETTVDEIAVESLVSEKLTSALRAIVSQMDLFEIHTQRDLFAERVKEHVKDDLEANGLLLESVTISELDQTDPGELSDNNVFDAQGKRKITEITAAAAVDRNNLERSAEEARKRKDVETRQQILELDRQQSEAESRQGTIIAKVRAEQELESQSAILNQERQIELARIDKTRQLETQEIARSQAIEIAKTQQQQAVEMAVVEREKGVILAERQKQIVVAEQETLRAQAEEGTLRAQAEREKASQEVVSVQQLAEADREASKRLIAARQEIEQDKLRQQTTADVEAYTQIKRSEAERDAAKQQAEARVSLGEAEAQARELVARGERAQQMVAVNVAREQVGVEEAKVAVERQQLENRQQFAQAGIQLEVQKLTIQADRDVQIEFAKSLASFLSNGHMTLYGTPETATTMLDNMAKGFGARSMLEGFLSGPNAMNGNGNGHSGSNGNGGGADAVGALMSQVGGLIQPAISKAIGGNGSGNVPNLSADDLAKRLADDPALLSALRDALAKQDGGALPTPAGTTAATVVTATPVSSGNGGLSRTR